MRALTGIAELAGADAAARWDLPGRDPGELARALVDHGVLRRRAVASGWGKHLDAPTDEMRAHGVAGDAGVAWELVAELSGAGGPVDDSLIACLGALPPDDLHAVASVTRQGRHAALRSAWEALGDPSGLLSALGRLPATLRATIGARVDDGERAALVRAGIPVSARGVPREVRAVLFPPLADEAAAEQRRRLAALGAGGAPLATWPDERAVLGRLRAGALACAASGYDVLASARASEVPLGGVVLAAALVAGDARALDFGLRHARGVAVRWLLSPASPSRAAAEELLGRPPGGSVADTAHLAWTLLVQLAASAERVPLTHADLLALLFADADAMRFLYTGLRPRADEGAAGRLLAGVVGVLEPLGLAWVEEGERVAVDAAALRATLQEVADARKPEPAPVEAPALARDGADLVLRAGPTVPLGDLVAAAALAPPRAHADVVEIRFPPALARAHAQLDEALAAAGAVPAA